MSLTSSPTIEFELGSEVVYLTRQATCLRLNGTVKLLPLSENLKSIERETIERLFLSRKIWVVPEPELNVYIHIYSKENAPLLPSDFFRRLTSMVCNAKVGQ